MGVVPVFNGQVTADGKLDLREDERDLRRRYLQHLAGKRVDVIIRKHREPRSIDQNAYLHAVPFPILAEICGDDIEGIKLSLMGEKWGWTVCQLTGQHVPIKPHTSDMSTEECAEFIDWLIPWAWEKFKAEIPWPNEAVNA